VRPDSLLGGTATLQAVKDCFTLLRKAVRLLIRQARNFRRVKYGKALLRMFMKKPSVALNSILRSSEGKPDNRTLPTDLSVLRDETTGQMLATPTEVISKLTQMDTTALSPYPTLPLGAPYPWLGHVQPTPIFSAPVLIGQIIPAIFQEALRSTPSHIAAGPDGVPGVVLKHMPPAFLEAIHLLI
jgi:hypothetical protein